MWYKKADNLGADDYSTNVKVNMFGGADDTDIYASNEVSVKFRIDVEAREWGIKHMSVMVSGLVEVPYTIIEYDENELELEKEGVVVVDLSQLVKTERKNSGVVTIGDMDLWLDKSGSVVYNRSEIVIYKY